MKLQADPAQLFLREGKDEFREKVKPLKQKVKAKQKLRLEIYTGMEL